MIKKIARKVINTFKKKPEQYLLHDKFWVQKVSTETIVDRISFFENIAKDKNVLHLGCNDWPIFNPSYNLHIKLSKQAKSIHGFDVDLEGIENLKKYVNQNYYSEFNQLAGNVYDVCLVPETIEHVDNVRTFLEGLSTINSEVFYITAPNCFAKKHIERNFYGNNEFIEVVHPDHNCWYSPFTLKNQIEKYSNLKVDKVFLLDGDTMVCCQASKK
ncbi:class I SAM-dependent methyltransferase [Flavobacterium sp. HXWNR69]|mgnify:FL=1|uniref:Class I SAM-dependent methyltransferase n=1 Tax=Flavobacterium fragile TaxID=2949085 RepID=A0ABT0TFH7_9FLAO|nr:methyltransferase domain-containing protein [Flavobacterium sp. HXWNR69]MCL9769735.1 class I SAM-dependent methyltransferase [Flavobacterium sp. HXWNR69]